MLPAAARAALAQAQASATALPPGSFIHIPKTGGTSVSASKEYRARNESVRQRALAHEWVNDSALCPDQTTRDHRCLPSPELFVADIFSRRFGRERTVNASEPTFCVVREPTERWLSTLHWSGARRYNFSMSDQEVAVALQHGRFGVENWTEQLLHMQPQSWYVWAEDGSVSCRCVVAFESVGKLTPLHLNRGGTKNLPFNIHNIHKRPKLPEPLRRLYARDELLHRAAQHAPRLCFEPDPQSFGGAAAAEFYPPPEPWTAAYVGPLVIVGVLLLKPAWQLTQMARALDALGRDAP